MMDASSVDVAHKLFDEKPNQYIMKYDSTIKFEICPFQCNQIPVIVFQSRYMIATAPKVSK